jgi:L-malate glycosyltransferase
MRKSILFLTNAYPDFEGSNRGIFIKEMVFLLQKEGYQISVVTPKIYRKSHCFEDQKGIKVYRFPFWAGNKLLIEYEKIPYLKMVLYYLTGIILTGYVLFRNRCSLIHAHWAIPTGLIGAWVESLLKKPLIVTIHGSDLKMAMESPGLVRKLFLYVCKRATQINCVSEAQKREIQKLGVPEGKISTIPMGIDETFVEVGENRKHERNKQTITILSNRNLLPNYNVSQLIKAIPRVLAEEPGTKFLIAGNGEERKNLEELVARLKVGVSVQFLGQVPHQEMGNLLAKSDIYVSTSLSDGTSVSLLEAMGAGVFPVVTDIPSNREWISNGDNGFLFPVGDEGSLADRIVEGIRNKELLERAAERNQEIVVEKGHWKKSIYKTIELYDQALRVS